MYQMPFLAKYSAKCSAVIAPPAPTAGKVDPNLFIPYAEGYTYVGDRLAQAHVQPAYSAPMPNRPVRRYVAPPAERQSQSSIWPWLGLAATAGTALWLGVKWYFANQKRKTRLMEWCSHAPLDDSADARTIFRELDFASVPISEAHTHPTSAGDRSSGTRFINAFAQQLGVEPFFMQMSRSDQRRDFSGSRSWYWTKDLNVEARHDEPGPDHLLAMVDVDHYIDMPHMLARNPQPYLMYTFQPHAAARTGEYSYHFNSDNTLHYTVSGGGVYTHAVWKYGQDAILVIDTWFGIPVAAVGYAVERRVTSQDHELILLAPMRVWKWWGAWTASYLEAQPLKRLQAVQGEFVRMRIQRSNGVYISTGHVGDYAECTVTAAQDAEIASLARTMTTALTQATVRTVAKDHERTAILTEYHRKANKAPAPMIFPIEQSVHRYQFDPPSYDPEAKPLLHPYCTPIVHGAFAPDLTPANEQRAVLGRVVNVRTPAVAITPFMHRTLVEFVSYCLPEHACTPADDDEVYARQNKPSQLAILRRADVEAAANASSSFIKAESYGKVTDPRIISTIDPRSKVDYARYIYPVQDLLAQQPWCAVGKKPKEIAERVAGLCRHAREGVGATDFSKMDGHVNEVARQLEVLLLTRAYPRQHRRGALKALFQQMYRKSRGIFHLWLNLAERMSGEMATAVFNTALNAYCAYLHFRLAGYNPELAWNALGIYLGDDGLTPDSKPEVYTRACTLMGQTLEVETIRRGAPGVNFLARYYGPEVWEGDENSCCDIARQLGKFHTTPTLVGTYQPATKAREKAISYLTSDANTPVIGALCRAITDATEARRVEVTDENDRDKLRSFYYTEVKGEQYPNRPADWMLDLLHKQIPTFDMARFTSHLTQSVGSVEKLLRFPLCAEPPPVVSKMAVVVNGVVYPGEKHVPPTQDQLKPDQRTEERSRLEQFAGGAAGAASLLSVPASTVTSSEDKSRPQAASASTDSRPPRRDRQDKKRLSNRDAMNYRRAGKGKLPTDGQPRRPPPHQTQGAAAGDGKAR